MSHLNIHRLLNGTMRRSSHVYRYSAHPVHRHESVADHSHHTTMYCMIMGEELIDAGFPVDMGKLMMKACPHDIEESTTGDVRRDIKHGDPKLTELIERVGTMQVEKLAAELGINRKRFLENWESSKDSTIEGQVVRTADALNVVAYINEELDMGNKLIMPIFNEVKEYLGHVQNKVSNPLLNMWVQQVMDRLTLTIRREHMIENLVSIVDDLNSRIKILQSDVKSMRDQLRNANLIQ